MSLLYTSIPSKTLSESITAASTSFKLNNIEGWDGANLTSGDFGTVGYGVFRNSTNSILELFEFDPSTIASTSITINKRGLKFTGDLTTQVSANKLSWTKGDTFVDLGSDVPQFFQFLKEYIDSIAIAGSPAASTTQAGIVELTIASEINTGTDATRAITPDSFAGSNFGTRYVAVPLNGTTALTTSDKRYLRIPAGLTGMNLVSVTATVGTGASGSSSSGTPTFTVKNVTDNNQMLSTSLTVDASEYSSATAAVPVVINTSFDDVVTDDLIEVAVTTSGTGVTFATVTLGFSLP